MKNELFPALRKELENSFGRKVLSSRDCLQMVDDIFQKTGYTINVNTLRRFFGLVRSNYSASPSTLSILLKYCGFNSPEELEKLSVGVKTETVINKEEVHHFLLSLFKNISIDESNNGAVDSIVFQTVNFLERNPDLIDRFQREVAATTAGQYYYFERAVNMDRLSTYYGQGLRFYLRANQTNEAFIFANSVEVLLYWLTNEMEKLENAMSAMSAINVNNSFPPHIMARYLAARLFYANIKGDALDRILAEASRFYSGVVSKGVHPNTDFELILAEALILTQHYTEGSEYIRKGKQRLGSGKKTYEGDNLFGIWEKIVNTKRSASLKNIINPARHSLGAILPASPLVKKYYTLLYLRSTSPRSKKAAFSDLIRETGFSRLA